MNEGKEVKFPLSPVEDTIFAFQPGGLLEQAAKGGLKAKKKVATILSTGSTTPTEFKGEKYPLPSRRSAGWNAHLGLSTKHRSSSQAEDDAGDKG